MIHSAYYHSPFGCFEIKGNDHSITQVWLLQDQEAPPEDYHDAPEHIVETVRQLTEYFNRQRTEFDLPLDFSEGTLFNQSVWKELLKIPYGHTSNYSAIAKQLGNPEAVRAVGLANRGNPIAIIIPCHRVIAKNGDLQGYFYGLEMKRKLLELENPMSYGEQGSLF
ncbi:MAG: methylated-DNA--[protein]-cysteine S-methyltransferase [Lewinellaceae bacterium]|nr:methylated-DNA--[protein]-cysteine S-methyltransferase [Saprospiraceae bacterium]MCB9340742.1 methylated-DNA--[protein]-cysteine S-methyltransferase [Lewinellaceae bacterium]